jgi:signal transduction histidine kinase
MSAAAAPQPAEVTWPIRYQLLLPNLAVLGLAVFGAAMLGAVWAGRIADQRIDRQMHGMASALANSRFPLTDAVLAQVRDLSGAKLAVTDQQGQIVTANEDVRGAFSKGFPPLAFPSPAESAISDLVDQRGEGYLHCTVMLSSRTGDEEPRTLHVLFPVALWWDAVGTAVWPPLLVGLVGAGCGIPVGLRLAWRMASRIERLRQHMARLEQGAYEHLAVEGPPDELRALTVAANQLSDQLNQLHQAIRQHERLSLVGQLSAGLLHQLRNCAAGARMAVQIHRKHCVGSDQESLDVAQRQLDLLSDHVQRYLVMRPDERPIPATCSLHEVLQDVARLLEPTFRHRRLSLAWNVSAGEVELPLSAENLRHLLSNLLTNAADAAGADGWVRVDVAPERDETVEIRISDSGPGLAPSVLSTAFEPFVTTKQEGIGLGLAICLRIAEDCGGSLTVDRAAGATCFTAILPVAAASKRSIAPLLARQER